AHPSQAKPTGKRQFVFLNGRHIRDKLIVAAIREGYKGFLEPRLHPVVFLHLECEPSLIDVNVHPTKAEVRFRRDREIFGLVKRSLNSALNDAIGGFSLLGGQTGLTPASAAVVTGGTAPDNDALAGVRRTVIKPAADPAIQERFLPRSPALSQAPAQATSASPADDPVAASTSPAQQLSEARAGYHATATTATPPAAAPAHDPSDHDLPGVRRIVQLHDMYLLIETDNGIRIIDQHALHEKALFLCLDPALTDFSSSGRQELLIPKTIELSAAEIAAVEPQLAELTTCGIEAEVFGPTTLLLRAHPSMLAKLNWAGLFADLAAQGPGPDALTRLREAIGHRRACRAAVKAGDRLSESEQRQLVRLLLTMDGLEHCPHGRPTTLDIGWDELEQRFMR
ncbi:MAG: DNA mismatch repair MutL family protein, partial [Planctomycetota bacterium]